MRLRRDAAKLSPRVARSYYLPVAQRRPQPNRNKSGALAWISDTVRRRGLFGALRHYAAAAVELLRDLTPARRQSRYGDIDYDFEHNVDSTWATVSLRTRLRELLSGGQYQPSEPELFHEILNSLPVAVDGFTFIDLGSGKGRTLLMASEYPFRKIVGVELIAELHRAAEENIRLYRSATQRCSQIEAVCADACEFVLPATPLVLYLFHPLPEVGLQRVLRNLERSLEQSPRPGWIVYHNPAMDSILGASRALVRAGGTEQYSVFKNL